MNKIPVGKTIAYAYAFTFGHLGAVIGLTWVAAFVTAALNYVGVMAMNPSGIDEAMLRVNPALALHGFGYFLLCMIGMIFAGAVIAVALVRQALGLRTGGAVMHFAAGRDEWRMFGAHLRLIGAMFGIVIIFYIGALLVGLVGAAAITFAATQSKAAGGIVGFVVLAAVVALACVAIATLIRMGFLLSPTVVAERPGGIQRSYTLTKGNVWRIVGVWLAVSLPLFLLLFGLEYVLFWKDFHLDLSNLPSTGSPEAAAEISRRINVAMQAVNAEMMRQQVPMQIGTFAFTILYAALSYSASAFAYRALVPASAANA